MWHEWFLTLLAVSTIHFLNNHHRLLYSICCFIQELIDINYDAWILKHETLQKGDFGAPKLDGIICPCTYIEQAVGAHCATNVS